MKKTIIKKIFIYDKEINSIVPLHIEPFELKIPFDDLRKEYQKKYGNKYSIFFIFENQSEIINTEQKVIVYPEIKKTEFNPANIKKIREYIKTLNNF